MKRLTFSLIIISGFLCFAQTVNTITITIPSDIATAYFNASAAEYAIVKNQTAKYGRALTEDTVPSTMEGSLKAEIATLIADKVQHYSPKDLPAKQNGETDLQQRNIYQAQVKANIIVK